MRPVVGVSRFGVRAVGGCCPRRPEEEISQFLTRFGIGQGVGTHRKVFARFVQRWLIAIQADVIRRNAFNRFDARIRQLHAAIFLHTTVEAIFLNHFRAHGFLLHFIQLGVFFAKISLRG